MSIYLSSPVTMVWNIVGQRFTIWYLSTNPINSLIDHFRMWNRSVTSPFLTFCR